MLFFIFLKEWNKRMVFITGVLMEKNRCGTRKLIDFKRNEKCICQTNEPFWRQTKEKYKQKRKHDIS